MATQAPEAPKPIVELGIVFDPNTMNIQLNAPTTIDPLLVFQLLNQLATAQLPGLAQEITTLRAQVRLPNIVPMAAIPADLDGIVGPGKPSGVTGPGNLREFRRRNQ